jgi:hypothetical protein
MENFLLLLLLSLADVRSSEPQISPSPVDPTKLPRALAPSKLGAKEKAEWSKYGRLHETDLRCENGQPIYALRSDGKLIAYVTTAPGKTLESLIGRTISVFGATVDLPSEPVQYILATHVAVP